MNKETAKQLVQALEKNTSSNIQLGKALVLFGGQLRTLAKETGDWRKEDNTNHSNEARQRKLAIGLLREIKNAIK